MSDTKTSLLRKINVAGDLQSVVRTMKAVAFSCIGQYEEAINALDDYYHTVELGLGAYFRKNESELLIVEQKKQAITSNINAFVFGSGQGLVGQFNELVVDYTMKYFTSRSAKAQIFTIGDRVNTGLAGAGLSLIGSFTVPSSVKAIIPLVGDMLVKIEQLNINDELYLFYNRIKYGAVYETVSQRLLPLDENWLRNKKNIPWPTVNLTELIGSNTALLRVFIHEYLFVSLFRASAQSLASENASRLASMQRADKNIDELLKHLKGTSHRLRQNRIDEELFDVISGFEALNPKLTLDI